ncbi:MAG: hypothetical protein A2493_01380 [Candidatus Magasanikbacteria bacterium RIFOXYC12_FULL_33_11]|uniref:Lipoprotein n=1 Tax=Candidatus Magasanikbacteria bacterium RIFOXYC12_FULL_33_11 TaxID=1798701 RepID=A0A1F6NLW6_9BACT|nr:MAG: hypothetical protein A2493_01380 [Candidatus Magasanikbacteria bacterium RIFOXYC12_FULL_33_11]
MRKKFLVSFFLLTLAIVATGCSSISYTSTDEQNTQNRISDINMPEKQADIVGIVKAMVGNEVTITQIDMDKMRESIAASRSDSQTSSNGEGSSNNFIAGTGEGTFRGTGMGPGGGMGPGVSADSEERNQAISEMMKEYSAGDVKVIIPVGIAMNKRGETSSLADVAVGSNLSIWLNNSVSDKKVADYVSIR